jgi:aryl-alcohol dehydrogenase-like predicted oxidoreductase
MNIKMANVMGSPLNSGPLTGGRRNKNRSTRKGKKNAKKQAVTADAEMEEVKSEQPALP